MAIELTTTTAAQKQGIVDSINGVDKSRAQTITGQKTFIEPIVFPAYTVGALPAAASNTYGRAFVSDCDALLSTGIGAVVNSGGANIVPVFSDGSNWIIG